MVRETAEANGTSLETELTRSFIEYVVDCGEALAPEYEIICAMLKARTSQGMTQQQLAERTGIRQGDISKIEHGN